MSTAKPEIQGSQWRKAAALELSQAVELLQDPTADLVDLEDRIQDALRAVQTMKALRKMIQVEATHPGLIDRFIGKGVRSATNMIDLKKAIESAKPPTHINLLDAKRMIEIATLRSAFSGLDARIFNRNLLDAAGSPEEFDFSTRAHILSVARKQAKEQGLPHPSMDDVEIFCAHRLHVFLFGDLPAPGPGPAFSDEDGCDETTRQRPTA